MAEAHSVPSETNFNNNIHMDGSVKIKIVGDINGDKTIDIFDTLQIGGSFSAQPSTSMES